VVRFDFLGYGYSDKPAGYPYTATNQAGDLTAIALYSTPVIRALPPAPSSGGGRTWTGDFTPGRSAGSSTILSCAQLVPQLYDQFRPPGPRSGDSTMT